MGDPDLTPGLGRFPWRKERLPTPVFWPGEFHGLYSAWGHEESDTTEQLSHSRTHIAFLQLLSFAKVKKQCILILKLK